MNEKEQKLYDAIMEGGYGVINTEGIMISGNIEILKSILLLPALYGARAAKSI